MTGTAMNVRAKYNHFCRLLNCVRMLISFSNGERQKLTTDEH